MATKASCLQIVNNLNGDDIALFDTIRDEYIAKGNTDADVLAVEDTIKVVLNDRAKAVAQIEAKGGEVIPYKAKELATENETTKDVPSKASLKSLSTALKRKQTSLRKATEKGDTNKADKFQDDIDELNAQIQTEASKSFDLIDADISSIKPLLLAEDVSLADLDIIDGKLEGLNYSNDEWSYYIANAGEAGSALTDFLSDVTLQEPVKPHADNASKDTEVKPKNEAVEAFKEVVKESLSDDDSDSLPANKSPAKKIKKDKAEETVATDKVEPDISEDKPKQNQEKLKDFGEVLHGAAKFTYALNKAVSADIDVKAVPLSKSFPQPNYEKLIADGLDPRIAAVIAQWRGEIKTKPRRKYSLGEWAKTVLAAREQTARLLNGDLTFDSFLEEVNNKYHGSAFEYMTHLGDVASIANELLPSQVSSLAPFKLYKAHYTIFNGEKNVSKWAVIDSFKSPGMGGMANMDHFESKDEALAFIKSKATTVNEKTGKPQAKFDIWREKGKDGVFLGKKVASRKYIELKMFSTVKEAREYMTDHNDELVTLLAEKKKVRAIRRLDNNPRVGIDYRAGTDVTPKLFDDTFGFRGVQFGNWVEGGRRQQDLNNAYDGLLDLASLLGIPPKAISLNGTLGLAFGARGRGGKQPAAAHYEPGGININLTKMNGSGSLAHEFFHAVDNYFGTMDGNETYLTEAERPKRKVKMVDNYQTMVKTSDADFAVRREVFDAWKGLTKAIQTETKLAERSAELDNGRGKDYWSTVREMTARSFERYVIDKLSADGFESDYLANVVSEKEHGAINDVLGSDQSYPYPLDSEMEAVNSAYDALFNVLETRETDKGVALYSKSPTKTVIKLTGDEIKVTGAGKFEDISKYFKDNLQGQVIETEIGQVQINRKTSWNKLKENLKNNNLKGILIPAVRAVLEKGSYFGSEPTYKTRRDGIIKFHYFDGKVELEGRKVLVELAVGEKENGQYVYNLLDDEIGLISKKRALKEHGGKAPLSSNTPKGSDFTEGVTLGSDPLLSSVESFDDINITILSDSESVNNLDMDQAAIEISKVKGLNQAIKAGLLKVVQSVDDIPDVVNLQSNDSETQGVFFNGIAYVIANNNTKDTLASTAWHELTHAAMNDGAFEGGKRLFTRIERMKKLGEKGGSPFWKDVNDRVSNEGVEAEHVLDEIASYAVTEYLHGNSNLPSGIKKWTQDFIDAIKSMLFKFSKGKIQLGNISAKELLSITEAYIDYSSKRENSMQSNEKKPLFSKAKVKGSNTSWADQDGFENISQDSLSALTKIGKPPVTDLIGKAKERINEHKYRWRNKLRQGIVDQFDSFKSVLQDDRTWMKAHLAASGSGTVEAALEYGQPFMTASGAIDLNQDKKSLGDIFNPLGSELDRFLMWVAGNRAEGINKRADAAAADAEQLIEAARVLEEKAQAHIVGNITVEGRTDINEWRKRAVALRKQAKKLNKQAQVRERLFTQEEIDGLKSLADNDNGKEWAERKKTYEAVRKDFEEMHNAMVQIGVDTGLVSKTDALIWKNQGFYVPFYRLAEEDETSSHGTPSVGGLVGKEAYKKMKGADMQLNDLLGNTLMNWNHIVTAGLSNQAAASALESASDMGLATEIKESQKGKGSIFVRENGKEKWYNVEKSQDGELVRDSLTSLDWNGLNTPFMKGLRMFKRALTIGVTASPEFKIANLIRDTLQAIAVTDMDVNFINNVKQGFKATSKDSKTIGRMIAGGGAFTNSGYVHGADPDAIKLALTKGVKRAEILTGDHIVKKLFDKYQDFGGRLENVNRAANFEQNIANGMDLLEANFGSRDHLDFQRTGSFTVIRAIAQTVPFLNARLQGLDKLARAAADPEQRKQFGAVVGMYSLASIAMYAMMADDDDYKEAEQWERDTYHLFKLPGSDVMYRIPRPFEVGAIANIAERAFEQLADDEVHGTLFKERLLHMVTETFALNPVPQALKPAMEVWGNKNTFTGRAIESMSMRNLSPVERKRAWSSQFSIGASKAMDAVLWDDVVLSPVQIDHLIRGYLGWVGAITVAGTDQVLRPLAGKPSQPSWQIQDYTLIGRFVREGKASNSRFMSEFYDTLGEISRVHADINQYRENHEFDKVHNQMIEHKDELRFRKTFNATSRRLSKINNQIDLINKSRTLTSEQKRNKIDVLNRRRTAMARKAVERFNDAQ